jgi:trk system potassium uptake protein
MSEYSQKIYRKALDAVTAILRALQGRLSPSRIVALSFVLVIATGAFLLSLPISHAFQHPVSPLDALFTSTSAVCVTGLVTVTTATSWSLFGKVVIMLLIQIGGLGLTTLFTLAIVQMGRKVTLKERLTLQASFNANDLSGMVRMVLLVIRGTLLAEGIGAACLSGFFINQGMGLAKSVFYGVFHSISAFCNAGFDLIGDFGFIPYSGMVFFNLIITSLIILGGIGFIVWSELNGMLRYRLSRGLTRRTRLSMHSKIVLISTAALITIGTLYFLVYEYSNPGTLGPMPFGEKLLASYFQSVTLRTAGFMTIPQGALHEGSKLFSCFLMLIGGSPGGTAGGMKTVTLAVLLLSAWSTLRGQSHINLFGRSLPLSSLQKALTVALAMGFVWICGSVALSFTEAGSVFKHSAADILFETSSALGTVGVTTGLTPYLSAAGKIILILCMYIGRIGPLTLVVSVTRRTDPASERIHYPNEDVLIG